jgi:hypothetical protein
VTTVAPPAALSAYQRLLIAARGRGFAAGRAELTRIDQALRLASRDLERIALRSPGTVTGDRATGLRVAIRQALGDLETRLSRTGASTVAGVVRDTLDGQRQVATTLRSAAGRRPPAAFAASFDRLNPQVLRVLAARRGGTAVTYQTLIRRNMADAGPVVDRLVTAGVSRGASVSALTRDLARLLEQRRPETFTDVPRLGGLSSIRSDARRIARTETMNALREANRFGLIQGGIVAAVQWTLNAAHAKEDACDELAEADDFGYGPGYYPPTSWPLAPHPNCGCYQGAVQMKPVSEWD